MVTKAAIGALVLVLVTACSSGATQPDATGSSRTAASSPTSPAATVEIRSSTVPLPADVAGARFPWWTADGTEILFSATPPGAERVQVMRVAPDGSDLRCLSCGVAPDVDQPLLKPIAFPDGKRIAVRVGNQSPLAAADHAILECRPSVAACDHAELVPVTPPASEDPVVVQDQRELRVAPDGEHVGLSQVRRAADGEPDLVAVVARLRRTSQAYELVDPRVVSSSGELKSFTPDGTRVLVAEFTPGPFDTANPDVISVDLTTGDRKRITFAADYDEPVEYSPDGSWYAVGSGRGTGLFETVSQLRRPSLLGSALDPLTAYLFAHHRDQLLEGWLVRSGREAEGASGQRIPAPDGGLDGRPIWNWRPDGTALVYWEAAGTGFETDPQASRLVVADLDLDPSEPDGHVTVADPEWAPRLEGFTPPTPAEPRSREGRVAGTVDVEVTQQGDGTTVEITYRGFADRAGWTIDGTERAERRGDRTTYTADLRLSGDHEGSLRADAVIGVDTIDGAITSEVDGRTLRLPRPGTGR